ncbi:MAG: hypothetical protein C4321_02865 [Chloroflexota bacterium]
MCQLLAVNRGSFYRQREPPQLAPSEGELRAGIEAVVLEFPAYGYRRVTKALQRSGWRVNHKHVLRLMREESLLCRLRRRWVKTTDSEHGLTFYPNRLKDAGRQQLTRLDEAWVAAITYIRLPQGFCYLAAILDGFSRKVVGWALAEEIDGSLVLAALRQALETRKPAPGWIPPSDRGVQYACHAYVERLKEGGAEISMSGKGRPRDNAQAESFMRTLKHEEVYLEEYQSFSEAKQAIWRFIDAVYNEKRLHSSLSYRPPSELEQLLAASFFRKYVSQGKGSRQNLGFRCQEVSTRHRRWGVDPACDLDFPLLHSHSCEVVALIELKYYRPWPNLQSASILALADLGIKAGILAFVASYRVSTWVFEVYPINELGKKRLGRSRKEMSEKE